MELRGDATRLSFYLTCLLFITAAGARSTNEILQPTAEGAREERVKARLEVPDSMLEGEDDVVVVKNGTAEAVLDCPYQLNEDELQGVSIKWYHPSVASPVYQWIPDDKPTAMWILRDRVDLNYQASKEALHRYRAIKILNPTTDLAGTYRCNAGSFTAEKSYTKKLVVFAAPRDLKVWVEDEEEDGVNVTVTCKVEEVFPQPDLHLYQVSSTLDRKVVTGETPITSNAHGTYTKKVTKVVEVESLEGPTEYQCQMTIPQTKIRITASTKYQPPMTVATGPLKDGGGSSTIVASYILTTILLLLATVFLP